MPNLIVIQNTGLLAQIADLLAGNLAAATVDLYTNDFTPLQTSVIGDFVLAGWTGYTQKTIGTWGAPFINLDSQAQADAPTLQWNGPTGGSGPIVYGYLVRSAGTGTPLLFAQRFDAPIPMTDATAATVLVPQFTYQGQVS